MFAGLDYSCGWGDFLTVFGCLILRSAFTLVLCCYLAFSDASFLRGLQIFYVHGVSKV